MIMLYLYFFQYFHAIRSQEVHWAILAVIISGMSVNGIQNISEQRSIIGKNNITS